MKLKALIALTVVALLFSAASLASGAATESKIQEDRVGIVFDIGGKDDRSFNAAAWVGVKCAETGKQPDGQLCKDAQGNDKPALGVVLRDVEPGNPTSIEPAMRAFAERGFDLVIGVGFAQGPIMQSVARDYPNIRFAIIDGVIFEDDGKTPKANVASLVFKEHEGSYLVGIIAGMTSKTGVVGFIEDGHRLSHGSRRVREGAKSVNPNFRSQNYVGATDGPGTIPERGKEIALAQISKVAIDCNGRGHSGLGAFDASRKREPERPRDTFVIAFDSNQKHEAGIVRPADQTRDNVV